MRSASLAFTVLLLVFGHPCSSSQAGEFRVETDVFVGDGKEPSVETLTIFSEGIVYDFLLTGVEEITVFDQRRQRLVLLDTKRKVKTELPFDSVLEYIAQMKVQLSDSDREAFLAEQLEVQLDDAQWLTLTNGEVTYRAEGVTPKFPEAATEYQLFADWYARLNAMREGNPPPFARIRLNAELASHGWVPKNIERKIAQQRGLQRKTQTLRSQHLINWRLSQTDRKQIDRAGTYLVSFADVPFPEYLRLPTAKTADATPNR